MFVTRSRVRCFWLFAIWASALLVPAICHAQYGLQNEWGYTPLVSAPTVAYSHDGTQIAIADRYCVQIFTLQDDQLLRMLPVGGAIAFSPRGGILAGRGRTRDFLVDLASI